MTAAVPQSGDPEARIVLDEIAWYAADRAARAKSDAELRAALESIAKVASAAGAVAGATPTNPTNPTN